VLKVEEMGVISKNEHQIKFYYSSASSIGKQALAYVQSSERKVLTIDVLKTDVTGTQWTEIASGLGKKVKELIDLGHPDFINQYGDKVDIPDEHDWLKILEGMPSALQCPIIVNGNFYLQIVQPSDVKKFLDREESKEMNKK
jgi:arsenate reductase-like glutaredoxin family protein